MNISIINDFMCANMRSCIDRYDATLKVIPNATIHTMLDISQTSNNEIVKMFGSSLREALVLIHTLVFDMAEVQESQFIKLLSLYKIRLYNTRDRFDFDDFYLSLTYDILQDLRNYKTERITNGYIKKHFYSDLSTGSIS